MTKPDLKNCGNPDCRKVHCDLCGNHSLFRKHRVDCTQCGKRTCIACTGYSGSGYPICFECAVQEQDEFVDRNNTRTNHRQEAFSVLGCRVYGIPMLGHERLRAQALISGK